MVYKGRKKKTVQFFALKCVDKTQKQKIMREVKFLRKPLFTSSHLTTFQLQSIL
jgi:hypothetical protein